MDLFTRLNPPCGDCVQLGDPIESGVRYCWGELTWRWAEDRVEGCPYREKPSLKVERSTTTRAEALRDLLESPRHSIAEKDRKWLKAELRRAEGRSRAVRRETPTSYNSDAP